MSECRKALLGAAMAVALLATSPVRASDERCAVVSANFVLCEEGTQWAEAVWEQSGDSATLEHHPYHIEFFEHWLGRTEGQSLDTALDMLLAELQKLDLEADLQPPELLLRDDFKTESLRVERAVERIYTGDDQSLIIATMIAEAAGARIAVVFSQDNAASLDVVRDGSRDFIVLIHPGEED